MFLPLKYESIYCQSKSPQRTMVHLSKFFLFNDFLYYFICLHVIIVLFLFRQCFTASRGVLGACSVMEIKVEKGHRSFYFVWKGQLTGTLARSLSLKIFQSLYH